MNPMIICTKVANQLSRDDSKSSCGDSRGRLLLIPREWPPITEVFYAEVQTGWLRGINSKQLANRSRNWVAR